VDSCGPGGGIAPPADWRQHITGQADRELLLPCKVWNQQGAALHSVCESDKKD
jgi:hypothetical protein